MIPVTKAYIPDRTRYHNYVGEVLDSGWLTNGGRLLNTLEQRLAEYLGVAHVICVANGSIALQVAYKALGLSGEVITSPFSFVATSSTLVWEGLTPVYGDICPHTFNLDPKTIVDKITPQTRAIVPVHVYGNPCDVDAIAEIANEHNLKVIYDAAHAFGTTLTDADNEARSVLTSGDISTVSFHATKLFHTIEGGAIITQDAAVAQRVRQMINFGITGLTSIDGLGTNAKMNEMEAAMGLCVLDEIQHIRHERQCIWERYHNELQHVVTFQTWHPESTNNHAYAPVLLASDEQVRQVQLALQEQNVFTRRYFYPSLDTLSFGNSQPDTPIFNYANDIASRVLCLPIYPGLTTSEQSVIIEIMLQTLSSPIQLTAEGTQ